MHISCVCVCVCSHADYVGFGTGAWRNQQKVSSDKTNFVCVCVCVFECLRKSSFQAFAFPY